MKREKMKRKKMKREKEARKKEAKKMKRAEANCRLDIDRGGARGIIRTTEQRDL